MLQRREGAPEQPPAAGDPTISEYWNILSAFTTGLARRRLPLRTDEHVTALLKAIFDPNLGETSKQQQDLVAHVPQGIPNGREPGALVQPQAIGGAAIKRKADHRVEPIPILLSRRQPCDVTRQLSDPVGEPEDRHRGQLVGRVEPLHQGEKLIPLRAVSQDRCFRQLRVEGDRKSKVVAL